LRLTSEQRQVIRSLAKKHCQEALIEVYLFGSRVNDALKGGDIDLLFVVNDNDLLQLEPKIYAILNELKKEPVIGNRRIDLKLTTPKLLDSDPFLKLIKLDMLKI